MKRARRSFSFLEGWGKKAFRPARTKPSRKQRYARAKLSFLGEKKSTRVAAATAVVPAPMVALPAPPRVQENPTFLPIDALATPQGKLRQSIEGFLLDQRSEHTRRAYARDLKRFVGFLLMTKHQGADAATIDRTLIIRYKDQLLAESLSHTSVDRHLSTLKSFFRWLVEDGVLLKSPAEGVRFLNPGKLSPTQGFTDEEVRRILLLPNLHTRVGAQHYAILMVLFFCGLRRSELCEIQVSQIRVERGHPVIRLRGKGNKERIIVLPQPVWSAIQHYLKISSRSDQKDGPLFAPIRNNRTGQMDRPLDPSMIYYIVTRYAKKAGIQGRVSPHSCRATAISNARDHQVPDRAIQEFAGWSSTDMITRYDKRRTSIDESAAHSIDYGVVERRFPEASTSGASPSSGSVASSPLCLEDGSELPPPAPDVSSDFELS